jgi:transcriptional regulator with XRE-family HTH domain
MLDLFAVRLKEERIRLGFNQEDFAHLGGVSKNTQLGYEQGIRTPDVHYLFKIEDHGADLFYLLDRGKEQDHLCPTMAQMLALFSSMSAPEKALAFGMMTLLRGARIASNGHAEDSWRHARLLAQFMAATDAEKHLIENILTILRNKNITQNGKI